MLTLDYVDLTTAKETRKGIYFYQASQMAFANNGMERNPWDSAVQFRDELITKTFPADSGFEVSYRFTVEDQVPNPLHIVIERPDLYQITCNGHAVSAAKESWWLDKAFGKIDITAAAKTGNNLVTLKAAPFSIYHEIEPAYVLGDFNLRAVESGFAIMPAVPLSLGGPANENELTAPGWNGQGHPFYATGVSYTERFQVSHVAGCYSVSLPDWYGSVAKVIVNGHLAGHISHAPWQCDVTDSIQVGDNTIEVVVIGTLRNTLGPHHNGPMLGKAWPSAFRVGPETGPPAGASYHTVRYGLFAPFLLMQEKPN